MIRMIGGKTSVVWRMPILSGQYQVEPVNKPINNWNHQISFGYLQGASRQKVVLNIDNEQRIHETRLLHYRIPGCEGSQRSRFAMRASWIRRAFDSWSPSSRPTG